MRRSISPLLTTVLALAMATASAQDTKFVPFPSFKQTMIAGPGCLEWREAWEGGWAPCASEEHARWLKDVTHWRDKTDDLQYAFFNGIGWESWENVWGIWNGITPRDAEATRRVATLERGLGATLNRPGWEPFYPTRGCGVFASRWPGGDRTAWTIVNRNEYAVSGTQFVVPHATGRRWFDLYHGIELAPQTIGGQAMLSFDIEAEGYGAIVAVDGPPDPSLVDLMTRMKTMTARPLSDDAADWRPLPQRLVPIPPTLPRDTAPEGMVKAATLADPTIPESRC